MLCAALGSHTPTVAAPFAKHDLTDHPAWLASLAVLRDAGVRIGNPHDGATSLLEPIQSGTGALVTAQFNWRWVLEPLDA